MRFRAFFVCVLASVATGLSSCKVPAPRRAFLHERIQRVVPDGAGGAEVAFEFSARRYVIQPGQTPEADQLLRFARAAAAHGRPVYATFDPGDEGPTRPDGGAGVAVLLRLADTPDPAARR
jgi:hypothetical protein